MEISSMQPGWLVIGSIIVGGSLVWLIFCLASEKHAKGDLVSQEIAFLPATILGVSIFIVTILPYVTEVWPVLFGTLLLSGTLLAFLTSVKSWFKVISKSSVR